MGDVIYNDTFVSSSRKRPRKLVYFVIALLLLLGCGFGVLAYIGATSQKQEVVVDTVPTPTVFAFPTDSPTPTPLLSPTIGVAPTVSVKTSVTPTQSPIDPKTKLDRSALAIAVQNGSGEVGAATKASDYMKSFGYHVVSVGNADSYTYEDVTINIKASKEKYLSLLKTDITKQFVVASSSAALVESAASDAVVIFGK